MNTQIAAGAGQGSEDVPLFKKPFSGLENRTLEQKIQDLADREGIKELIARYAHCVAHRTSVAHLFTDDGVFIVRGAPGSLLQEARGREQLIKEYAKLEVGPSQTLPMIHNHLIEVSGDAASGLCSVEIRMSHNGQSLIASGYYQDRYRRENGRWKFTLRDAFLFHMVPIQQGWAAQRSGADR